LGQHGSRRFDDRLPPPSNQRLSDRQKHGPECNALVHKMHSFAGAALQTCEVRGAVVHELFYGPHASRGLHAHPATFVSFVAEGEYKEWVEGRELGYKPNTIVLHPAGEAHAHLFGPAGGRVLIIETTSSGLEHLSEYAAGRWSRKERRDGWVTQLCHRLLQQMQNNEPVARLAIEGLVLEILSELLREGNVNEAQPLWMKNTIDYLYANFAATIQLAEVARRAAVHPVHLARSFRSFQGCTLGQFIRLLRIRAACLKLTSTNSSITEIALDCGFFDHSHFCRVFRRQMGVSPGEFRRAQKKPCMSASESAREQAG